MDNKDKAIEIMKAAMEKEKGMKERSQEDLEQQIENQSPDETQNEEILQNTEILEDVEEETEAGDVDKPEKSGKSFFKI